MYRCKLKWREMNHVRKVKLLGQFEIACVCVLECLKNYGAYRKLDMME